METNKPVCGWEMVLEGDNIAILRNGQVIETAKLSDGLPAFLLKMGVLLAKFDMSFNPKGGWMRIANAN